MPAFCRRLIHAVSSKTFLNQTYAPKAQKQVRQVVPYQLDSQHVLEEDQVVFDCNGSHSCNATRHFEYRRSRGRDTDTVGDLRMG